MSGQERVREQSHRSPFPMQLGPMAPNAGFGRTYRGQALADPSHNVIGREGTTAAKVRLNRVCTSTLIRPFSASIRTTTSASQSTPRYTQRHQPKERSSHGKHEFHA